jgi:hypothetical protein
MPRKKKEEVLQIPEPVLAMKVVNSVIKVKMDEESERPKYYIGWVLTGKYSDDDAVNDVTVIEYEADLLLIHAGLIMEAVDDGYVIRGYVPIVKVSKINNDILKWVPEDPAYFTHNSQVDKDGDRCAVTCELVKRDGLSDSMIEGIKQANMPVAQRTPAGG